MRTQRIVLLLASVVLMLQVSSKGMGQAGLPTWHSEISRNDAGQLLPGTKAPAPPKPGFQWATCTGSPEYCNCVAACQTDFNDCLAGCPPVGSPGRVGCVGSCNQGYRYCTVGCPG